MIRIIGYALILMPLIFVIIAYWEGGFFGVQLYLMYSFITALPFIGIRVVL